MGRKLAVKERWLGGVWSLSSRRWLISPLQVESFSESMETGQGEFSD